MRELVIYNDRSSSQACHVCLNASYALTNGQCVNQSEYDENCE